ncbi:fatty acyl-AMP ligase [Mycobacterium sp. 1465703.0]|uniref:fatty acyl-AMP ligase n=1 Tax=Mycobacterium sp. 1465703.0 TaxID=1834078 RepID=UPI000A8A757C
MGLSKAQRLRARDAIPLDACGNIVLPQGVTVTSYLDDNAAEFAHAVAYRYLDFDREGQAVDLTWEQLGTRVRAVGARLQQVCAPGDRVAILAPHGIAYVVGFFAAIAAGAIAVPLFAPELPGHTQRLKAVLADAQPAVALTTMGAAEKVTGVLAALPRPQRPRVIAVDAVPDTVGTTFTTSDVGTDDIAYLQYTSGSTRTPSGVQISHRAVCTNVLQMIHSMGLDWDIRSVSWLPLYHDMGLLMIMYPALFGGRITLMSPVAFVRRPYRWIKHLALESREGRTFAAAPNFAYELTAQRGLPPAGESLDLSNVAGLINGSEPVSMASITKFTTAFRPFGLAPTTIKPSYGLAEATLFVSTIAPEECARATYLDRQLLAAGYAAPVSADAPTAVPYVSCGRVALSQWAVIVDPQTCAELAAGRVGEIWLHGDNIGRGYWSNSKETEYTFNNRLQSRLTRDSHTEGASEAALWLRTGDLGVYLDGELYITGRIKDLVIIDGRNHYPQDLEATAAQASSAVRAGFVAAFSVPGPRGERLVIVAERAPGAGRLDPAPIQQAIRGAISARHGVAIADVLLVVAGAIPRTTSGKLARRACRAAYLEGRW